MTISYWKEQGIPLALTGVILAILVAILWGEIFFLNLFTPQKIFLQVRWADVVVGMTIYLKTSIDFAIFIGNLMQKNAGWKSRVAIEIGTAVGNALGTLAILAIWTFFKEINILLAAMVVLASLVLLQLAQEGLEHAKAYHGAGKKGYLAVVSRLDWGLGLINTLFSPLLSRLIPHTSMKSGKAQSLKQLFFFSFSIPFILGLDDFAGYVPLFSIVNVFGFAIGVMTGHTVLNVFLFLNPHRTISVVKNPFISFAGALAFIGLAVWGIREGIHLLM